MAKKKLKIYVWENFSPDYTDGLAVAIAETIQEAQKLIEDARGFKVYDWGDCVEHELGKFARSVGGDG